MITATGKNSFDVKNNNRLLVLQHVICGKDVSRIQIANKTNLSKMTLTNITNYLLENNFLCEKQKDISVVTSGKKPTIIDIHPNAPVIVGISVRKRSYVLLVSDLKLNIIKKSEFIKKHREFDQVWLNGLIDNLKDLISDIDRKILAIGVSSYGAVDIENGTVTNSFNATLDFKTPIEKATGLPVFVNNDVNANALAETLFGHGKNYQNYLCFTILQGVGASIVSNGGLVNNSTFATGGFGHISINCNGEICKSCGNRGCLEVYVNPKRLLTQIHETLEDDSLTWEDVWQKHMQLPAIKPLIDDYIFYLSTGFISLCNMFQFDAIVLTGDPFVFSETDIKKLEDKINENALSKTFRKLEIVKSNFAIDHPHCQSIAIVLDNIFSEKLNIFNE